VSVLEGNLSKISSLETDMDQVKIDLKRALRPSSSNISQEDIDKWNDNCKKTDRLEELVNALMKEMQELDGTKIKADIL